MKKSMFKDIGFWISIMSVLIGVSMIWYVATEQGVFKSTSLITNLSAIIGEAIVVLNTIISEFAEIAQIEGKARDKINAFITITNIAFRLFAVLFVILLISDLL